MKKKISIILSILFCMFLLVTCKQSLGASWYNQERSDTVDSDFAVTDISVCGISAVPDISVSGGTTKKYGSHAEIYSDSSVFTVTVPYGQSEISADNIKVQVWTSHEKKEQIKNISIKVNGDIVPLSYELPAPVTIKISDGAGNFSVCEKIIKIKRAKPDSDFKYKKFTICGKDALSGSVTVPYEIEQITSSDVVVRFDNGSAEGLAVQVKLENEPVKLTEGKVVLITVKAEAKAGFYKELVKSVQVIREKETLAVKFSAGAGGKIFAKAGTEDFISGSSVEKGTRITFRAVPDNPEIFKVSSWKCTPAQQKFTDNKDGTAVLEVSRSAEITVDFKPLPELELVSLKIAGKAATDGKVELPYSRTELTGGDFNAVFKYDDKSEAIPIILEPARIKLRPMEPVTVTMKAAAKASFYKAFSKDIIITRLNKAAGEDEALELKELTILGKDALNGSITVPHSSIKIESSDVKAVFETFGTLPVLIEGGVCSLKDGTTTLKLYIPGKKGSYLKWEKSIDIERLVQKYPIKLRNEGAGTVEAVIGTDAPVSSGVLEAAAGSIIRFSAKPKDGYKIKEWICVPPEGFIDNKDGTAVLTVREAAEVSVKFTAVPELVLESLTICGKNAINGNVTVPESYTQITAAEVNAHFKGVGKLLVQVKNAPVTLTQGAAVPVTFFAEAKKGAYKYFEKTINVTRGAGGDPAEPYEPEPEEPEPNIEPPPFDPADPSTNPKDAAGNLKWKQVTETKTVEVDPFDYYKPDSNGFHASKFDEWIVNMTSITSSNVASYKFLPGSWEGQSPAVCTGPDIGQGQFNSSWNLKYYLYKSRKERWSSSDNFNPNLSQEEAKRQERFYFFKFTGEATAGTKLDNSMFCVDRYSKFLFFYSEPASIKNILGNKVPSDWCDYQAPIRGNNHNLQLDKPFYMTDPVGFVKSSGEVVLYQWVKTNIEASNYSAVENPHYETAAVMNSGKPGYSPYKNKMSRVEKTTKWIINPDYTGALPVITQQPESIAVKLNGNVTLKVRANQPPKDETLTFKWYSNNSLSNSGGTAIDTAAAKDFKPDTRVKGKFYYYCVLTGAYNGKTSQTVSNAVCVEVSEDVINAAIPVIKTHPANVTADEKQKNVKLSVKAEPSDGGSLSYQWFKNNKNSNSGGDKISSAVNAQYEPSTEHTGIFYYYCVVTNTNVNVNGKKTASVRSKAAEVKVIPITNAAVPIIKQHPESKGVKLNGEAVLSVEAVPPDGGKLSYQWYRNGNNSNSGGIKVNGAEKAQYAPPTSHAGAVYYYCAVTNTNSNVNGKKTAEAFSNPAKVEVSESGTVTVDAKPPKITEEPQDAEAEFPAGVQLTIKAESVDDGDLSFKWYKKAKSGNTDMEAGSGASFNPETSVGTFEYYCIVTNTNNAVNGNKEAKKKSRTVKVVIKPEKIVNAAVPLITKNLPAGSTVLKDSMLTLSVTVSVSDTGSLSYQWYRNTAKTTEGAELLTGETLSSFSPPTSELGTFYYYCRVTNTNNAVNGGKVKSVNSLIYELIVEPVKFKVDFSCNNSSAGSLEAAVDGVPLESGDKVEEGQVVTFTAKPNAGYGLDKWELPEALNPEFADEEKLTVKLTVNAAVAVKVFLARFAVLTIKPKEISNNGIKSMSEEGWDWFNPKQLNGAYFAYGLLLSTNAEGGIQDSPIWQYEFKNRCTNKEENFIADGNKLSANIAKGYDQKENAVTVKRRTSSFDDLYFTLNTVVEKGGRGRFWRVDRQMPISKSGQSLIKFVYDRASLKWKIEPQQIKLPDGVTVDYDKNFELTQGSIDKEFTLTYTLNYKINDKSQETQGTVSVTYLLSWQEE